MLLQMAKLHSFLWLSSIPLCVCGGGHFFFIHSSGHLGSFHILAMINNAAMSTEVHVSFQISIFVFFFLEIYPGVELQGHTAALFLVF